MTFYIILLITFLVNFSLSIFVLLHNKRSRTNIYFSLFVLFLSLWIIFILFFQYYQELIFSRLTFSAISMVPGFFLLFIINFPKEKKLNLLKTFVILLLPLFFFLVSLTSLIAKSIDIDPILKVNYGLLYLPFAVYFISYFLYCIFILIKKYLKSKTKLQKTQLRYVLAGLIIFSILALLSNLILPIFDIYDYISIGPFFSIIFIGLSAVSIVKYKLLNIKIITAEFLSFILIIIFFLETVLSKNISELVIRLIFLILVIAISILLVRSVLKEVKQKEEIKKIANQLKRANSYLKQIDETKSNFISIVSHQLRTPIAGVKGYLSMLYEGDFGDLNEKQKMIMKNNLDNIERLLNLVNMFLDISRIEAGKIKISKSKIHLSEVINSIIHELQPLAEAKKLKLKYVEPKKPLPVVELDESKIRNVFLNIIDNSIKYTPSGKITISAVDKGKYIEVKCTDTGIGIKKEEIPHLFNKFVRAEGGMKINAMGTGLGLYVIKKFVEVHDGKVVVESDGENKGTTFIVTLPK